MRIDEQGSSCMHLPWLCLFLQSETEVKDRLAECVFFGILMQVAEQKGCLRQAALKSSNPDSVFGVVVH